jgi:hypothetical protein
LSLDAHSGCLLSNVQLLLSQLQTFSGNGRGSSERIVPALILHVLNLAGCSHTT